MARALLVLTLYLGALAWVPHPVEAGGKDGPVLWRVTPERFWELWVDDVPVPKVRSREGQVLSPKGMPLNVNDELRTGVATTAVVYFPTLAIAVVGPRSKIILKEARDGASRVEWFLAVAGDKVRLVIEPLLPAQPLNVQLGNAQAASSGGDYLVSQTQDGAWKVMVFDGSVGLQGGGRKLVLEGGHWTSVSPEGGLGAVLELGPAQKREEVLSRPPKDERGADTGTPSSEGADASGGSGDATGRVDSGGPLGPPGPGLRPVGPPPPQSVNISK